MIVVTEFKLEDGTFIVRGIGITDDIVKLYVKSLPVAETTVDLDGDFEFRFEGAKGGERFYIEHPSTNIKKFHGIIPRDPDINKTIER